MNLNRFDRTSFAFPFWKSNLMLHESLWPVGEYGVSLPLLFNPDEMLSVRSSDLQTEYKPGSDYFLRGGRLVIPEGSRISLTPEDEYIIADRNANPYAEIGFTARRGGFLFFSETSEIISRQITVSYRHSETWNGPLPPSVLDKLPLTKSRLSSRTPFTVGFWGDSITTGCNSSSMYNLPPYTEMWPIMVTRGLGDLYGLELGYINKAVGGKSTDWGVSDYEVSFREGTPELLFIAFGMNDASGKRSVEEYIENTRRMITLARKSRPDAEIILIATTLPNPEANQFEGPHAAYEAPLMALADSLEGVAGLPLTSFHHAILQKKNFRDMTGNNINHPNDFMTRVYAQYILSSLYDFKEETK